MKSLLLIMVAAVPAFAGPPTDAVKAANQTITQLLQKKAASTDVTAAVTSFIDIDELGKRAMSTHWSSMSASEQKEFSTTLHGLIEANYVCGVNANLDYKVAYTGEKQTGAETLVTTKITSQKKGRPVDIEVDYLVEKAGNGYRAVDVVTDGVSLIDNYRQQFDAIIAKQGVQGLIQKMQKKTPSPC
jgi:phospholipid transport system substrate-binding protein